MGYEEGFLSILQSYYEIKQYKEKELANLYTGSPNIRKILFWDTDFDKINWGKYKKAVIQRVLERGSKEEIEKIRKFYGLSKNELRQYFRSIRFSEQRQNLRKNDKAALRNSFSTIEENSK